MREDPDAAAPSTYLADSDDEEAPAEGAARLRGLLGLDDAAPKEASKGASGDGFDDDFFGAAEGDVGAEDVELTFEGFGAAEPEVWGGVVWWAPFSPRRASRKLCARPRNPRPTILRPRRPGRRASASAARRRPSASRS